jgi:hypothetical protein
MSRKGHLPNRKGVDLPYSSADVYLGMRRRRSCSPYYY